MSTDPAQASTIEEKLDVLDDRARLLSDKISDVLTTEDDPAGTVQLLAMVDALANLAWCIDYAPVKVAELVRIRAQLYADGDAASPHHQPTNFGPSNL